MNTDRRGRKPLQYSQSPERQLPFNAVLPTQVGSLRFWRIAIDGLPLPAFLLDPSHRIVVANKPMEELTKLHAGEIRGKKCWELLHGKDLISGAAGCPFSRVLDFGRSASNEVTLEILGKQCRASCSPIRAQNGKLKFILHTITEVTEITALRHAKSEAEALLAEKELILTEVHHRVKNNMATVAAMLLLQAEDIQEASAVSALEKAVGRINSMALLYDKLYRSHGASEISVNEYLPVLVDSILGNFPGEGSVVVKKDISDFVLDAQRLQILGIIANELLTNTMKYAFEGRKAGEIMVVARLDGNLIHFSVRDNGVGIGQHGGAGQSSGFGFTLVHGLAKQLDAELRVERKGGTKVVLEFGR
ncbi:MAG: histidine kinase dimerization/phosphoacceptor domain -containing protein [Rectinemataceae bacterium]